MQHSGGLGAATRPAGNLGCGELGKNPLPALEIGRAQGICAVRHVVMEGQGFFCARAFFWLLFLALQKK